MNCEVCRNSDICKFVYIGEDDKKRNIMLDKLHETDEDGVFRLNCNRYVKIVNKNLNKDSNKKPAEENAEITISETNKKPDTAESTPTGSLSTESLTTVEPSPSLSAEGLSPLHEIEQDHEENAGKYPAHRKRAKIDREKVIEMYENKVKPVDIAKELGCSDQSVYNIVREHLGVSSQEKKK